MNTNIDYHELHPNSRHKLIYEKQYFSGISRISNPGTSAWKSNITVWPQRQFNIISFVHTSNTDLFLKIYWLRCTELYINILIYINLKVHKHYKKVRNTNCRSKKTSLVLTLIIFSPSAPRAFPCQFSRSSIPGKPLPLNVLATIAVGLPDTVAASSNAFTSSDTSCPSTTSECKPKDWRRALYTSNYRGNKRIYNNCCGTSTVNWYYLKFLKISLSSFFRATDHALIQ